MPFTSVFMGIALTAQILNVPATASTEAAPMTSMSAGDDVSDTIEKTETRMDQGVQTNASERPEREKQAEAPLREPAVQPAITRMAGSLNAGILPSGRVLDMDEVYVSLEEFLMWRLAWGVSENLTVELRTAWLVSLGLELKYALVRTPEHNLAVAVAADAGVFSKGDNVERLTLAYTRDFERGALHAGLHGIRVQTKKMLRDFTDGRPGHMLIPELMVGGEAVLRRNLRGFVNVGYGDNVLDDGPVENTGYVDLGFRIGGRRLFADLMLVIPMTEEWLAEDFLGLPYLRIGGSF